MQKVSYMGNGVSTEFTFNFPYFESTDVVVTKNGAAATGYNIIGTSGGLDADIPYTGGKVVFETAPTALDCITIARSLPLTRQYDYQPLEKINPTTLNQDMNYLMEVLKDLQDELESLSTQYAEIADKESTTALLAQISAIHDEIVAVDAQITALGDISTLRSDVTTNAGNITTLDTRTTGLIDYVIASQAPTAENNYTWYRKYKSGWVEQGGVFTNFQKQTNITMPITMQNTNYCVCTSLLQCAGDWQETVNIGVVASSMTTTGFTIQVWFSNGNFTTGLNSWHVSGMAAA